MENYFRVGTCILICVWVSGCDLSLLLPSQALVSQTTDSNLPSVFTDPTAPSEFNCQSVSTGGGGGVSSPNYPLGWSDYSYNLQISGGVAPYSVTLAQAANGQVGIISSVGNNNSSEGQPSIALLFAPALDSKTGAAGIAITVEDSSSPPLVTNCPSEISTSGANAAPESLTISNEDWQLVSTSDQSPFFASSSTTAMPTFEFFADGNGGVYYKDAGFNRIMDGFAYQVNSIDGTDGSLTIHPRVRFGDFAANSSYQFQFTIRSSQLVLVRSDGIKFVFALSELQ